MFFGRSARQGTSFSGAYARPKAAQNSLAPKAAAETVKQGPRVHGADPAPIWPPPPRAVFPRRAPRGLLAAPDTEAAAACLQLWDDQRLSFFATQLSGSAAFDPVQRA